MKVITVLMLCGLAAAYTDMDDTLSVEELVKDVPRFKGILACYLDKGPCTPQYKAYKRHVEEIMNDGCRECNDTERHMLRVFLKGLREVLPTEYRQFKERYDPDNKHYEAAVDSVQNF